MRFHDALPLSFLLAVGLVPVSAHAQFPPVSKEDLAMTSDAKAPGAAAVYLYREETEDDPHAFRTIYARIKVLTEEGKRAAVVHVNFPQTFVYNAAGTNSSRMTGGLGGGSGSTATTIAPTNTAHWDVPSISH